MVDSHHLIRPIELTGVGGVLALFNTVDEAPPAHILIPARPGLLRRRLLGVVPRAAAGRGLIQMAWTTVRGPAMPPMGNPDDTVRPETLPPERPPEASSWELRPLLRLLLAADPVAPSVARQQVRRWLAALAWPTDQLQDIVLALSEAVTNAAEHAYRDRPLGMIELRGGIELIPGGRRRVTLTVRDHGRWRPPAINDGDRRRGIPLMRACMDTVTITEPDDRKGTQVVLRSRAIPTPG